VNVYLPKAADRPPADKFREPVDDKALPHRMKLGTLSKTRRPLSLPSFFTVIVIISFIRGMPITSSPVLCEAQSGKGKSIGGAYPMALPIPAPSTPMPTGEQCSSNGASMVLATPGLAVIRPGHTPSREGQTRLEKCSVFFVNMLPSDATQEKANDEFRHALGR
jgi:hypothetical protein